MKLTMIKPCHLEQPTWTISPDASYSNGVFNVAYSGITAGYVYTSDANLSYGVSPALYLTSDITLQGTGSELDPYIIMS